MENAKVTPIHLLVLSTVIGFAIFLNLIPYLIGITRSNSDFQFLGAAHHPEDYYYYLSQFAQGRDHWFLSSDLLSAESTYPTIVGWTNVFLGKMFSLVGISHLYGYPISVIVLTALFFFVSYLFLRHVFSTKYTPLLTLVMFLVMNGLPHFQWPYDIYHLTYEDYWFNLGNPLTRIGFVPHHLIANTTTVASFLFLYQFIKKQRAILIALLAISSLTLASINPIQWMLVAFVLSVSCIAWMLSTKKYLKLFITLFAFIGIGLPVVLYMYNLFQIPPYSQLRDWESTKHIWTTPSTYIFSYGIVGFVAVGGIIFWIKRGSFGSKILLLYGVISLLLSASPIPLWIGVGNVRFISAVTILAIATSATVLIETLIERYHFSKTKLILSFLIITTALYLPAYLRQLQDRVAYFETNNAYFYLPSYALKIFNEAYRVSSRDDTFIVVWPYNISFSGVTGRRQYHGHPLLTVDAKNKDRVANAFFSNQLSESEVTKLLSEYSITFIITFPWMLPDAPYFTKVSDSSSFSLYKVNLK